MIATTTGPISETFRRWVSTSFSCIVRHEGSSAPNIDRLNMSSSIRSVKFLFLWRKGIFCAISQPLCDKKNWTGTHEVGEKLWYQVTIRWLSTKPYIPYRGSSRLYKTSRASWSGRGETVCTIVLWLFLVFESRLLVDEKKAGIKLCTQEWWVTLCCPYCFQNMNSDYRIHWCMRLSCWWNNRSGGPEYFEWVVSRSCHRYGDYGVSKHWTGSSFLSSMITVKFLHFFFLSICVGLLDIYLLQSWLRTLIEGGWYICTEIGMLLWLWYKVGCGIYEFIWYNFFSR